MPLLFSLSQDELILNFGIVIISVAILIHRTKRYIKVNESFIDIISFKQSVIAAVTGGAMSLTATNVISLFGVTIAAVAVFLSILQFFTSRKRLKESERANNISQKKLELDEKKLKWEMEKGE